jgi:phage regulator Rha-like protein
MNELIKKEQRMTSLEIAEMTGKNHFDLMRAIRKMEETWEIVNGCKFALVNYRDAKGESRPCYSLTKTECLYIATKFNDEARARLVLRWEQLEKERIQQGAVRHLLVSDADVMTEAERIVTNTLVNSNRNADGCITMKEIAAQYGMDVKDMNSFLVDRGIQKWMRGQYRLTANYEGRGLAEDRLFIYYSKEGKQKKQTYLVWTQKGADFINSLL